MSRFDIDGKSVMDGVESPRRPLQRSPYPSPVGSTKFGSTGAHRSPLRTRHNHESGVSVEAAFLSQRMTSIEDRFVGLESLVSKLAGRLETFLRTVENDRQVSEGIDIRLSSTQEQLSQVQKATVDFGNRIVEQQRAVDRVGQQGVLLESTTQHIQLLERRVEESHRLTRLQADENSRQADAMRLQIAQATRLLQTYSRRQCEALSTENAARLDAFEQDRREMIQQIGEVTHGMNETRVSLADMRAQMAMVDRTLRLREEGERQHAEDIKVLQRRLLSAMRHLSSDASTYLVSNAPVSSSPVVQATYSPPRLDPTQLRRDGSPQSTRQVGAWPSSPSNPPPTATPDVNGLRTEDDGIDQFLAELNFLSRNAVV